MASFVIYYSTEAQKNEIYLFYIIINLQKSCEDLQNKLAKLDHAISWNTQLATNENAERTRIII